MKTPFHALLVSLATAVLMSIATSAGAATCIFNITGGAFNSPSNWNGCGTGNGTPAGTPGPADRAEITGAVVTLPSGVTNINDLYLQSATIQGAGIANTTLNVAAASGAWGTGTYNITGMTLNLGAPVNVQTNPGQLVITNAVFSTQPGSLVFIGPTTISGAGAKVSNNSTLALFGNVTSTGGGLLEVLSTLAIASPMTISGPVNLLSGGIDLNAQTLTLANASQFNFLGGGIGDSSGGTAAGISAVGQVLTMASGNLQGAITLNVGTLANSGGTILTKLNGGAPATLKVNGNYIQSGTGTINFGLSGPGATQYGHFVVSGSADFNYTAATPKLSMNWTTPPPTPGDIYDIITAGSIIGLIDNFTNSPGIFMVMSYPGTGVRATAYSGPPAVSVTGIGTFPNTNTGSSSAVQQITITNSGGAPLTLNSILHSNPSVFPDTTGGPAPQMAHWCGFGSNASGAPLAGTPITIAAGNSCVLNLIFSPNTTGSLSGSITVHSNAPTSPDAIAVSGTGTAPAGPSMTVSFSPASVLTNVPATMTLTLTNSSASAAFINGGSVTIPAGLVATPPGSNSCGTFGSVGSGVYSFGMGFVPGSGSCTIDLSVQSATASTYTVTIPPGALTAGPGTNTNTSTSALTVTAPPAGPFAYISNFGSFSGTTVSVIDTPTNTVIATVNVGLGPVATAVNPAGTRAYVSNQQANSVSVIDTSTNTVITSVGVGSQPGEPAVSPDGSRVYVPNQTSNNMSVIDTSTNTVVATVGSLSFPVGAAVNPGGTKVYVTNSSTNTVAIVSTATNAILTTVPVCATPYHPVFNASGTRAYVVCTSGAVSVIDTSNATVIATIPVGGNARGIAVHPSGNPAYTSDSASNSVSVIDTTTNTVTATLPAGNNPWGLALNPSGSRLYVASSNTNTVLVFDTSTNGIVATVPVGAGPIGGGQFIQPAPFTPTPLLGYSPPSLAFGSRTVNTTSAPSAITLTNSGSANVFFTSTTSSGDFAFTSTCPTFSAPLVPGASCNINVTFTPLTVGPGTGAINIVSNSANSPNTIPLSGTGTAVAVPIVTLSPAAVNYGNQNVGSPAPVQSILLTNSGFATLTISAVTVTGTSFTRVSPSSPVPDCTTSVAPGGSCYISIVFTPASTGPQTGQVSIVSNAASSPSLVPLSGTGAVATPGISVPASIAFGDQVINSTSMQTLNISNNGTATLNISSIVLGGANVSSYTTSGNCTTVAPSNVCSVTITFLPATTGSKTAQLTITSDAINQPSAVVQLVGNGILAARPVVDLSTTVIGYGNAIFAGATPMQTIKLSNVGGATMQIQNIYTIGDFVQGSNCTSSLASGASCLIDVRFNPLLLGLRTGELVVVTNAQTSPERVPLSGTGCRWGGQVQNRLFLTVCRN